MTENNHENKKKGFFPCIKKFLTCIKELFPYIIIALISLSLISWIYCSSAIIDSYWIPIHKSNAEILGVFGDFFGGTLNPILTFFALIFVIKSYRMQKEEVKKLHEFSEKQLELLKSQQEETRKYNSEQLELLNQQISHTEEQYKQSLTQMLDDQWQSLLYDDGNIFIEKLKDCNYNYKAFLNNQAPQGDYSEYHENLVKGSSLSKSSEMKFKIEKYLSFFNNFKFFWETKKIDQGMAKQLFRERFNEYYVCFQEIPETLKEIKFFLDGNKTVQKHEKDTLYRFIDEKKDLFKQFQSLIDFYKENFEE